MELDGYNDLEDRQPKESKSEIKSENKIDEHTCSVKNNVTRSKN